jgi:SagB-type dehydrogenase family enzyme
MKTVILIIGLLLAADTLLAQVSEKIRLIPPDKDRGLPVMTALSLRASVTAWDTTSLKLQDLSDLLWAANGVNRTDIGKRTAPSAMNAQDIDIYVFMKTAVYLYNAMDHALEKTVDGDHRPLVADRQEDVANAPVICLLVSDISRFRAGEENQRLTWGAIDAGTVSQNISLFCAATGIGTRPRATMDEKKIREILKLKDSQHLMLNNPVSYMKQ